MNFRISDPLSHGLRFRAEHTTHKKGATIISKNVVQNQWHRLAKSWANIYNFNSARSHEQEYGFLPTLDFIDNIVSL